MKGKVPWIPVSIIVAILSLTIIFHACNKDFSRQPAVVTDKVDKTQAQAFGKIVDAGGCVISDYGFCWDSVSITPDLVNSNLKLGNRSNTGTFQGQLTGLKPSTTYHIRAFLLSENGVIYGKTVDFISPDMPTVVTSSVTEISETSAKCRGSVSTDGGSPVTARGVCLSTTPQPDLAGNHTIDGTGTGEFISSLIGLANNVKYYVRTYATNLYGTTYGNELTFTAGQNITLPVIITAAVASITPTTAQCGGEVISEGGAMVTERGVCFGTSALPTTLCPKTSDGIGTGVFVSNLSGLSVNTLYYARSYAINSAGTAYGNEVSFTTSSVTFYIGQNYGGGIIFYIDGTSQHGLIAATSDQCIGAEWGCIGTNIPGTYTAIGTGQSNTTAIVNGCNTSGIAARICNDLILNGYNDWFLPSKDELNLMYQQKYIIGGFTDNYYWSSSQLNDLNAWNQWFYSGSQYGCQKEYFMQFVRAVRIF